MSDWIPVTERLPPVDEFVLFTCFIDEVEEDYFTDVDVGWWNGAERNLPGNPAMRYRHGDDGPSDWAPCSHWMQMPEPPSLPQPPAQ